MVLLAYKNLWNLLTFKRFTKMIGAFVCLFNTLRYLNRSMLLEKAAQSGFGFVSSLP